MRFFEKNVEQSVIPINRSVRYSQSFNYTDQPFNYCHRLFTHTSRRRHRKRPAFSLLCLALDPYSAPLVWPSTNLPRTPFAWPSAVASHHSTVDLTSGETAQSRSVTPIRCHVATRTKSIYPTQLDSMCWVNTTFVRFVHVFGPKSASYPPRQTKSSSLVVSNWVAAHRGTMTRHINTAKHKKSRDIE